jgi:hypothetical protein
VHSATRPEDFLSDRFTNPDVWLEDYHLACRMAGIKDDCIIIWFLPYTSRREREPSSRTC